MFALPNNFCHEFTVIQIFVIECIGIDVCIASNADQRLCFNMIIFEYLGNKMKNQFFTQHIFSHMCRHGDQTRKHPRITWDNPQLFFSASCAKHHGGINLLVAQKRKGLPFAHNAGREQRGNFLIKVLFQKCTFFFADFPKINQLDTLLFQLLHQCFIYSCFSGIQMVHAVQYGRNLFGCRHVGFRVADVSVQKHLIHQRPHAYHEKFIQIGLIDG